MLLLPYFFFDWVVNAAVSLCFCPRVHLFPCLCLTSLQPVSCPHPCPRVSPLIFVFCFCFVRVLCVLLLHLQIPTGPLIFNSLQQQQLSQFSPQQSQSATSSPQQQGETVRHAPWPVQNYERLHYSRLLNVFPRRKKKQILKGRILQLFVCNSLLLLKVMLCWIFHLFDGDKKPRTLGLREWMRPETLSLTWQNAPCDNISASFTSAAFSPSLVNELQ